MLFSFQGMILRSGGDSAVEIPVPIPNTEVKHCSGKNSRKVNRARCRVTRRSNPSFFIPLSNLLLKVTEKVI